MDSIVLLFCCLLSGFILRKLPIFDKNSPIVLNNLIVYFFIPVLTLNHIPKINFQWELIWLSITPFIIYFSSFIFIKMVSQISSFDKKTEGALIMTSGIGSISFVGFPVFETLYGAEGLSYGIVLSLAGTFMVFNTVGLPTGLYYSKQSKSIKSFIKKLFLSPPLIAFVLALMINIFQVEISKNLNFLLEKLSAPFSVIALLAIGMQIDLSIDKSFFKTLAVGQFFKLILAPIIIYILMWHLLDLQTTVSKVCILGAAIGSMNAISIVAAQMGLNPKLSSMMPALGIPISIPILFLIDTYIL